MDIKSNSRNKVDVIANDFYNDDYCTYTDKPYMNETLTLIDTCSGHMLIYVKKFGRCVFYRKLLIT